MHTWTSLDVKVILDLKVTLDFKVTLAMFTQPAFQAMPRNVSCGFSQLLGLQAPWPRTSPPPSCPFLL